MLIDKTVINSFRAARRASAPLIAVETPDLVATQSALKGYLNGQAPPMVSWDTTRGMYGMNGAGEEALNVAATERILQMRKENPMATPPDMGVSDIKAMTKVPDTPTANLVEALMVAFYLPPKSILMVHQGDRLVSQIAVSQQLLNLRDHFKGTARTVVLLCPQIQLPIELRDSVLVITEGLPDEAGLEKVVLDIIEGAELEKPEPNVITSAVDAVLGLPVFAAEQVLAMSIEGKKLNISGLQERKRQMIEQTNGLSVWRGSETFDSLGGLYALKSYLSQMLFGRERFRAIVFVDEIEKAIAGSKGENDSGVAKAMLGTLLSYMQDSDAVGMILLGPAGTGKSHIAKAAGNTAGIPTIKFSLTDMKAGEVGKSEQNLRAGLRVVDAVGQGKVLWIATCNSITELDAALRRRFGYGTFYVDLPDADERSKIWPLYTERLNALQDDIDSVNDSQWTGAEIKMCCDLAWRLNVPVSQAAMNVVPVAVSDSDNLQRLRNMADGKFLSATYPGVYRLKSPGAPEVNTRRVLNEE